MEYIRPKTGLLPKYVPEDQWIVMEDVHKGYVSIWTGMQGTLFCDIDGTIADLEHRRKYVRTKPKNWPAFEKTMHLDSPIEHVIGAVRTLYLAGWDVVMMTGRGAQKRDVTAAWLIEHNVPYHAMYTRALKDYRSDDIVKEELLAQARADGYDPDVVFDDRDQVVAMWRRVGVPVVQVAEGDF